LNLMRWIRTKYKRLLTIRKTASVYNSSPVSAWFLNGRDDKSAVTTDCHAGSAGAGRPSPAT